ncbi:MAG: pyrroline-5-carboxylate reductase [Bauldia sp.]
MDLAPSFTANRPLVLVGAGKMGGALLAGWLGRSLRPDAVRVIDPSPPEDSASLLAAAGLEAQAVPPMGAVARVLVVAVKPQLIGGILPGLKLMVGDKTVVVSIAAGTTIAQLDAGLGPAAIVRTMPNTPAQVGRGITAAVANAAVDDAGKALVTRLLDAVGETVWLDDERLIDAVTAVSGSGPAYLFLLAECLAEAGVAAGLPADVAAKLARATVTGAGELLYRSDLKPAQLRQNVTSPNGTTSAALAVLMGEGGLAPLMTKAVAAARKRSRELSG